MDLNKVSFGVAHLNKIRLNALGKARPKTGEQPPEVNIDDALLLENGGLFLMEDSSYFRLEEGGVVTRKIDKSYWNF